MSFEADDAPGPGPRSVSFFQAREEEASANDLGLSSRPHMRSLSMTESFSFRRRVQSAWSWLRRECSFQPWEDVNKELAPLSLRILPIDNFIRKPLIRLIRWPPFEWLMLLVIVANCVTLAMQSSRPGFQETALAQTLLCCDYFFIAAFAIEMIIKIIALGFVTREHSYLRSGWNVLDLIVVIFGFLQLSPSIGNNTAIRAIRVLRPLRLVTKIEALRLIVAAVINSLPMLQDVAVLWIFFFIIFGVICLQLFSGKLYYRCGQPTYVNSTINGTAYTSVTFSVNTSSYVSTNQVCKGPMVTPQTFLTASGPPDYSNFNPVGGKQWGYACPSYPSDNPNDLNYPNGLYCTRYENEPPPGPGNGNPDWGQRQFDNILYTWIAVFQHVIPQDWSFIMYNTQASVTWWTWLLHIPMAIIGGILISNLVVAILFINFIRNYSQSDKIDQTLAMRIHSSLGGSRIFSQHQSLAPASGWWARFRRACRKIEGHRYFENLSMTMIILNAVVLGIVWYPNMPNSVDQTTTYLNYSFTFYFVIEMIVRLLGLGPKGYVSDGFNVFDGIVTILGVIEVSLDIAPGVSGQPFLSALRAFRLVRIFRLVRSWSSLRRTMQVFILSLQSVGWLTALLALFLFVCGLLGMSFFGYNLDQCPVSGSVQLCPPGLTWRECPAHFDCYVRCDASQVYQWFDVDGSPYGGQAYCEVFPRRDPSSISPSPPSPPPLGSSSPPPSPPGPPSPPFAVTEYTSSLEESILNASSQFWAQVGKATTFQPNYDDIFQGFISIFVMLTGDGYDTNMKLTMVLTNEWVACLFTLSIMIIGVYIVLNLFLAILLANLDHVVEDPMFQDMPIDASAHVNRSYPSNAVVPWPPPAPPGPQSRIGSVSSHMTEDLRTASYHNAAVAQFWNLQASSGNIKSSDLQSEGGSGKIWADDFYADGLDDLHASPSSSPANYDFRAPAPWSINIHAIPEEKENLYHDGSKPSSHGPAPVAEGHEEEEAMAVPILPPSLTPSHQEPQRVPAVSSQDSGGTGLDRLLFSDAGGRKNNAFVASKGSGGLLGSKRLGLSGSFGSRQGGSAPTSNWAAPRFISAVWSSFTLSDADHETYLLKTAYLQQVLRGRSLFLFGGMNPLRRLLAKMIVSSWFDVLSIAMIALSSLELCFDDAGVEAGSKKALAIYVLDIFFTVVFGIEALMKIIVYGFVFNGKSSYIRDAWNAIDFLVVIVGILTLSMDAVLDSNTIIWLRALRALRALRPIKIAARVSGVRVVVSAMITAFPKVVEILLVALLFYYIFAILAVSILGGLLFYCNTSSSLTFSYLDPYYIVSSGNINKTWCEANDGSQNISTSYYHSSIGVQVPQWQLDGNIWGANGNVNRFDNVIMALFVLFQCATLENWSPIMYNAMTATGIDQQPLYGSFNLAALFFVFFILFCVFFILNMVIGVSINAFNDQKRITGRSAMLTEQQQEWLTLQRMISSTAPTKKHAIPNNWIRKSVYSCVMTEEFDIFIIVVVFFNVGVMFLQHDGQSEDWSNSLSALNAGFTGIYVLEMLVKWLAIGFGQYFENPWCIFDFVVVVVSVIGVIIDYTEVDKSLVFLPLLRSLRVLRVIKIVPKAKGLRMMILTLFWCIPALLNVGSVFFLVMFIYAIIGMNIFGYVKLQQNLTSDANFQTFPSAMMLLFRMTMGENWNNVMTDLMVKEQCILVIGPTPIVFNASNIGAGTGNYTVWPGTFLDSISDAAILTQIPSNRQQNACSPNPAITAIYFETYMLIVTYLLLQLVIGIIIENIEHFVAMDTMQVTQDHILTFVRSWEHLDNEGTGFVHADKVTALLNSIPPPMGVKDVERAPLRVQEIVQSVNIPLRKLQAHFLEVLHALTWRVSGCELPASAEYAIHDNLINRLPKDEVLPKYSVGNYYAALKVQTYVRGFLFRMKLSALISNFEECEAAEGRVASEADIGAFVHRQMSAQASRLLKSVPSGRIRADGALIDEEDESALAAEASSSRLTKGARLRKTFRDSRNRSLTREQKRELLFMVSNRARTEEYVAERHSRAVDDTLPDERQSGRFNARSENGSDKHLSPFTTDDKGIRSSPHASNRLSPHNSTRLPAIISEPSSPHASSRMPATSSPASPHTSNRFKKMAQELSVSQARRTRPSDPGFFWPDENSKKTISPRTSQSGAMPDPTGDRPSRTSERSLLRVFGGKRPGDDVPKDAPLSMLLESLTQQSAVMVRAQDPNDLPLADDSMDFNPLSSSLQGATPPDSPRKSLKKALSAIPESLENTLNGMAEGGKASDVAPLVEGKDSPTQGGVSERPSESGSRMDRESILSPRGSSRGSTGGRAKLPPMSPRIYVSPPKK